MADDSASAEPRPNKDDVIDELKRTNEWYAEELKYASSLLAQARMANDSPAAWADWWSDVKRFLEFGAPMEAPAVRASDDSSGGSEAPAAPGLVQASGSPDKPHFDSSGRITNLDEPCGACGVTSRECLMLAATDFDGPSGMLVCCSDCTHEENPSSDGKTADAEAWLIDHEDSIDILFGALHEIARRTDGHDPGETIAAIHIAAEVALAHYAERPAKVVVESGDGPHYETKEDCPVCEAIGPVPSSVDASATPEPTAMERAIGQTLMGHGTALDDLSVPEARSLIAALAKAAESVGSATAMPYDEAVKLGTQAVVGTAGLRESNCYHIVRAVLDAVGYPKGAE